MFADRYCEQHPARIEHISGETEHFLQQPTNVNLDRCSCGYVVVERNDVKCY